jgi:nicotinamidase-related amidase
VGPDFNSALVAITMGRPAVADGLAMLRLFITGSECMSEPLRQLKTQDVVLLVIDVQEKLLPAMQDAAMCEANVRKITQAARTLGVPVVVTEQYPAGLGHTCAAVRDALGEEPAIEKMRFSACVEPTMTRLTSLSRKIVIVVGIETHVCLQQTVLDLLRLGYVPYVCADAVSSRRPIDRDTALARMRQAGAVVTTIESVIFELLGEAGTAQFKQILKIIK